MLRSYSVAKSTCSSRDSRNIPEVRLLAEKLVGSGL